MSAPVPSSRRLALAVGAATASATVAIGVTAASLLGWFTHGKPAVEPSSETSTPSEPPAPSPVILVPVTPTPTPRPAPRLDGVQLVMDVGRPNAHHDDHDDDDDEEADDD
jgi:hypothetical protein